MDNVVVFEHPLIQHKISLLRDKNTGTNEFRQLVDEIAMLEGFEALSDLPVEDVEIETPIEKCMSPMQQVVLQWMRSIRSRNMVARISSLCALLLPRRDWSDYTKSIRIFRSM